MGELRKLADEVEGTTRRLTTRRMDQVVAKNPEWLWPGRIPIGTLTLFVGHPGVGKSTWAYHVAARLSRGELGPPADTVIATVEDSAEYTIAPRLEAARADRSRIHLVYIEAHAALGGVSLPGDINELRKVVLERKARWVVIDPLPAQLSQEYDSYKDQGSGPRVAGTSSEPTWPLSTRPRHRPQLPGEPQWGQLIGSMRGHPSGVTLLALDAPRRENPIIGR